MVGNSNSGRKPKDDTPRTRTTCVRGDPDEMDLLKDKGYSYSDAFSIGARILNGSNSLEKCSLDVLKRRRSSIDAEIKYLIAERVIIDELINRFEPDDDKGGQ